MRGPGRAAELGHLRDERRRQVVDHEPAEVLEDVGRLRAARARQPGDDDDRRSSLAQAYPIRGPNLDGLAGTEEQQPGDGRGVGVLGGPGQEPGRRRRLVHALDARGRRRPARSRSGCSGRWTNGMNTSFSTSSIVSSSTRYGPMRQYCSGGSSIWSSIQPLPGVCSSGWFRKNRSGRRAAAPGPTSAMAASTSRMCSNTRQATTASNDAVGERQRGGAGPGVGRAARRARAATRDLVPRRVDADDDVDARRPRPAGRPGLRRSPTSSTRAAPARCSAASGRICSVVLGVGAVGEPVLPPAGVRLPQVVGADVAPLGPSVLAAAGRRIAAHGAPCVTAARAAVGAVDLVVDGVGHGVGQPGERLQLVERRLLDRR